MRIRPAMLVAAALLLTVRVPLARAQSVGPDVIVGELAGGDDIRYLATSGGISAFAFRTESCNIGDRELVWYSSTNQHPVISQNMFRLMSGRFEQIGQAWVKHGFATENQQLCGACQPTNGDTLGVGCSDAYSSFLNANIVQLGPKSQVNASKGFFLYPFTAPSPPPGIGRRLQVHTSDLEAALNPGAIYFIEAEYITPDDAFWNNSSNNASWRQVTFTPNFPFEPTPVGPTHRKDPAIFAWLANDLSIQLAPIFVENDGGSGYYGIYWIGGQATFLGGCQWHYEYAVQNLNSFQSAGTFTVDLPDGVTITNIGFHDVDYHSGEPYSGTDWTATVSAHAITWATQTFAQNVNANALRWATLYNFRFDADAPPNCSGNVSFGLFRTPSISRSTVMVTPGGGSGCYRSGDIDKDCDLDGDDFGLFLAAFGSCQGANEFDVEADMDADECVDLVDYQYWLTRYREYVNDPQAPPPELGVPNLPGDMNGDAVVNQSDVPIFVDVLLGLDADPGHLHAADMDGNGLTDGRDVKPFVGTLMSGG